MRGGTLTLLHQFMNHVSGMDVNDHQSSEGGACLFGQLSPHHLHNRLHLVVELLMVLLDSLRAIADGLVHLQSPVDLGDAYDYLSRPVLYPLNPGNFSISLGVCQWVWLSIIKREILLHRATAC